MTRNITFIVIGVAIAITAFAQPPDTLWTRMYGGDECDECNSIQQTSDGGFILAGFTESFGAGMSDFYLVKTDSLGDTLWTRTFGGTESDVAYSVQQYTDGNYAIAGYTESFGAGGRDFYLVKTDEYGDTIWTRTFGGTEDEVCYSMIIDDDGNYILAGYTESYGAGQADMYLLKVGLSGDLVWENTYGDSSLDVCRSVIQNYYGHFILGGGTGSDIYLIRTDGQGFSVDMTIDIGSLSDCCNSIYEAESGGYILGGYTGLPCFTYPDMFIMKLDGILGQIEWLEIYDSWEGGETGGEDVGTSVLQTLAGGYLIGGFAGGGSWWGCGSWIIKTNSSGWEEWEYLSYLPKQECNSIIQTTDGNYVFGGYCADFNPSTRDMYLVKLSPEGITNVEEEPIQIPTEFSLLPPYPNPFNPTTTISFDLPVASEVDLKVFDINGRNVGARRASPLTPPTRQYPPGHHQITFDGSNLASGIYIYQLKAGNFTASGKMVLMK